MLGLGYPGWPRAPAPRRGRRPRAFDFPVPAGATGPAQASAGRRSHARWTSRSRGSRPRCGSAARPRRGTDELMRRGPRGVLRARRSSRRSRSASSRRSSAPASTRLALGGGVARERPAARAAWASSARRFTCPRRAVHRQRGDDRGRGAFSRRPLEYPEYLGLDVYATGERGRVSTVTVYTHADCHLCEEALVCPARVRGAVSVRADRARHRARRGARCAPTSSAFPWSR